MILNSTDKPDRAKAERRLLLLATCVFGFAVACWGGEAVLVHRDMMYGPRVALACVAGLANAMAFVMFAAFVRAKRDPL